MQAFSEIQDLRGLTQRPLSESRKRILQKGKKKPFPMWTMVFPFYSNYEISLTTLISR